jgi:hypothetical protein
MERAVEEIRRMRGGAQSHLMRCASDNYYVVKFKNNPQGTRVLANDLLATRLAARVGLPVAGAEVVQVDAELIAHTDDLVMQLGRGREVCAAGSQFGSRYPGDPADTIVYDFLPDEQLREIENLDCFAGMMCFDKWTCNTNGRQVIFYRPSNPASTRPDESPGPRAADSVRLRASDSTRLRAAMIDEGFCFNAGEWNFPDAPLRGIYHRQTVYENVRGTEAFEPWLERIARISEEALEEAGSEIPPEWYGDDSDALYRMLEQLYRRRTLVAELIRLAWKSSRNPFPNWT